MVSKKPSFNFQYDFDTELLTTKQASLFLTLSVNTLIRMRGDGSGPPFLKMGRSIRYNLPDLKSYLAGKRRRSTSDPGAS